MARKISAGSAGGAGVAGLQAFTTTLTSALDLDIVVEPAGTGRFLIDGNAQLQNQSNLRFADAGSSNYVAFQAPAVVPTNYTWTLPNVEGTGNQVLTTNGSGTLSWTTKQISVTNETVSSVQFNVALTSASSGNIAGITTTDTKLQFQPSTGLLTTTAFSTTLASTGSLGVDTAASGIAGQIRATNSITSFYSSDRKFKENIVDIPNALEAVVAIGGKLFDWTDDYIKSQGGEDGYFVQKSDFGVIAQDVQRIFPRGVRVRVDTSLAVDYEKLSALAFAAIAELKQRIDKIQGA